MYPVPTALVRVHPTPVELEAYPQVRPAAVADVWLQRAAVNRTVSIRHHVRPTIAATAATAAVVLPAVPIFPLRQEEAEVPQ